MYIRQCYISVPIRNTNFSYFLKKHDFITYYNPKKPSFFFGFYNSNEDVEIMRKHRSLGVVIWRGSDVFRKGHLQFIKKRKNFYSIAISSFIEKDLRGKGLKYKLVPLSSTKTNDLVSLPLGNEIFAYAPYHKRKNDIYNYKILKYIFHKSQFKINIICHSNQYSRNEIIDIYKRCFLGLRLTNHDGIANSVVEMGLMGRRSVYNGENVPGALSWDKNHIDKILLDIEKEAKNIGYQNEKLAADMNNYIHPKESWMKIKFYR